MVWFSLLLCYLIITESLGNTGGCLSQPKEVIWQKTGQSVTLPCEISSHCSANKWKYQWFTFKEKSCFRVKLHENHTKYKLNGASLHINSLHANDSGIYHCAVESHEEPVRGSQHVGPGTTLIVRDGNKIMVKSILLWLSLALLSIYSLALLALIVRKPGCRRIPKMNECKLSKKAEFSDVLQEMCRKRNMEKSNQPKSRGHSQAQLQAAGTESSADDIYQNV